MVARHPHGTHRLERIHDADHVRWPELRLDETGDLIARRQARLARDVIVVQEDRKQPHVVTRRFALLVEIGNDRTRRTIGSQDQSAVERDQFEGFDRLRPGLLSDDKILRREIRDRIAALVTHDRVDADEVDAGAEGRRLLGLRGGGGVGLGLLCLILSAAGRAGQHRGQEDRESRHPEQATHTSYLRAIGPPGGGPC